MIRIHREAFKAGVREVFWTFIAALAIAFVALITMLPFLAFVGAHAAIMPKAETPLNRPYTAKDAVKPSGQCIEVRRAQRFLVRPGGKWQPITGAIDMIVPCS